MAVDLMARWFMDRRVWICQVMLIYLGYLAEVAAIVMALFIIVISKCYKIWIFFSTAFHPGFIPSIIYFWVNKKHHCVFLSSKRIY